MFLGTVIGKIVPPHRHPNLCGFKLLWVQPENADGGPAGSPIIAVDSVGAGNGERVFLVSAMEASFACLPEELVPADAAIIGIIDSFHHVPNSHPAFARQN